MTRLAFLGTPEPAARVLRALVDNGHEVLVVVTQPDKRRRRGSEISPSPVKKTAMQLDIPVSHEVSDVLSSGAELGVVVAFGKIIKADVLDRIQLVNVHFSLLPRWRGAAPIERTILAGDEKTGVCLMRIVPELDAGPVYACKEVTVTDQTAGELRDQLTEVGIELLLEHLQKGFKRHQRGCLEDFDDGTAGCSRSGSTGSAGSRQSRPA